MTVATGVAAVDALRDAYDAIVPLPVTARWAWLRAAATHFPEWVPVVVTVDGGAAMLAIRRTGPVTLVTLLGHGRCDYAALPARDAEAAVALANEIARALGRIKGPWRARFAQVPANDDVLHALAGRLRHAEVAPGEGAPAIRFDDRGTADAYAGKNLRKQLRKAHNRLRASGFDLVTEVTNDVAALLPEAAPIHVARDHEARGQSDHDDPQAAAFWRAVLLDHAARGEVEATTMRIDGTLVGYALCFTDGTAYRFWDARPAPGWGHYSLGRLLDHFLLDRVLADGRWTAFDWMRGVEDYKLQTATEVVPYEQVTAWSSPGVRHAEALARSARRLPARLPRRAS